MLRVANVQDSGIALRHHQKILTQNSRIRHSTKMRISANAAIRYRSPLRTPPNDGSTTNHVRGLEIDNSPMRNH